MAVTADVQREADAGGAPGAGAPSDAFSASGAGLLAALGQLGPARLAVLGGIGLALLAFFAVLIGRAVQAPETLLYGGLDGADARQIVERLDAMGASYRLSPTGDAIMVPADAAPRLRMALAEDGLPAGGVIGYELFDRGSALGQTDFLSNVNLRRALEGELARTIATLRPVRAARVHLVQPERGVFRRDATPPSASIALALRGGQRLEPRQVQAIVDLVAAAVPGLEPRRVTLVDDRGDLLARGDGGAGGALGGDVEQRRVAIEEHLEGKIVELLERTVGPGKVDAEVSVELDLQQVTTTAETFDPEGQVARSSQTVEEQAQRNDRGPADDVSVANNLPTEAVDASGSGPGTAETTRRAEETVNYEVSRTVRSETRAPGAIKRLGIAVQVDGTWTAGADGAPVFTPLPEAELAQLAALVRSAAGVDEARGDLVEVVSRPFVQPAAEPVEEPGWLALDGTTVARLVELALLAAVALVVALFVVRPALARLLSLGRPQPVLVRGPDGRPLLVQSRPDGAIVVQDAAPAEVARGGTVAGTVRVATVGAASAGTAEPSASSAPAADPSPAAMVSIDNVAGDVQASLVKDVAQLVQNRPQDVIRTIRGWLAE